MLPSISFRWITPERLRQLIGLSIRLGILVIAAAVAILFASRWDAWVGAHVAQTTDDAYVKGDLTPLSAKVEGYLRKVPINDFQRVKADQLLVEIEDDDYKARVDQAEADVAVAEAAIENLKSRKAQQHAQVAEAQSAITATQADVERTRLEEICQRDLVASTYGTRQRLEQATADEKRFQATLARARDELESERARWGCSTPRSCSCAPTSSPSRRCWRWPGSRSATRASCRRWMAWSANAACAPDSMYARACR